jgi:hypothetical protein
MEWRGGADERRGVEKRMESIEDDDSVARST